MDARSTLEQLLAPYTNPESHNAQRHRQTDRRTDGQTDGQQAAANSRSYCVAVRSAKKWKPVTAVAGIYCLYESLVAANNINGFSSRTHGEEYEHKYTKFVWLPCQTRCSRSTADADWQGHCFLLNINVFCVKVMLSFYFSFYFLERSLGLGMVELHCEKSGPNDSFSETAQPSKIEPGDPGQVIDQILSSNSSPQFLMYSQNNLSG